MLTREMELVARRLYLDKKIRGFLHVYVGQVRAFNFNILRSIIIASYVCWSLCTLSVNRRLAILAWSQF